MVKKYSSMNIIALLICCVCAFSGCVGTELLMNSGGNSKDTTDTVEPISQTQDVENSSERDLETIHNSGYEDAVTEYEEVLENGKTKHSFYLVGNPELFSIVVPSGWKRGIDSFSETFVDAHMTKNSKRVEIVKRQNLSKEQWSKNNADYEGPFTGTTAQGYEYVGYYRDSQIEKDVNWRIYSVLILCDEADPYSVSVYCNLDSDPEDYLDTVVIPIVESVNINVTEGGIL